MGRSGYETSNSAPGSAAASSTDNARRLGEGQRTPRASSPTNQGAMSGAPEGEITPRLSRRLQHAPAVSSGLASSSVMEHAEISPSDAGASTLPPVREAARCPPIRVPHFSRQPVGGIPPLPSPPPPEQGRLPVAAAVAAPAPAPASRPFVTGLADLPDPFGPTPSPRVARVRAVSAGWQPYPATQVGTRMGYPRPYSPIPADCPA
jgi:hypothetical protein